MAEGTQFALGFECSTEAPKLSPIKGQLLKWIGNKQRFAMEIASFFPKTYGTYYEPFLGSGAVLATLCPSRGIGSDVFPPLMEIWRALKNRPKELEQWYESRWNRMGAQGKELVYESVKAAYNAHPNGADLVFLSRACYGGVVRFRKNDGYMSTPCGIHSPISPDSFARRVQSWHARVRDVEFLVSDYGPVIENARKGDLVYCDPPYSYSQGIVYGAQSFKLEKLLASIERCRSRGVYVALSIDGTKKSGRTVCDIDLPTGLFKREVLINGGRSMLRRFQMNGQTLEAERVQERLLLTY